MADAARELGKYLRKVRELRKKSLKAIAAPSEISPTYLQKLERGDVDSPSPHILKRLADELGVSYEDLMKLAGYLVPRRDKTQRSAGASILEQALSSDELTEEELGALAEYLAFIRSRRRNS